MVLCRPRPAAAPPNRMHSLPPAGDVQCSPAAVVLQLKSRQGLIDEKMALHKSVAFSTPLCKWAEFRGVSNPRDSDAGQYVGIQDQGCTWPAHARYLRPSAAPPACLPPCAAPMQARSHGLAGCAACSLQPKVITAQNVVVALLHTHVPAHARQSGTLTATQSSCLVAQR